MNWILAKVPLDLSLIDHSFKALAYLDPGSGSYLLQLLIGGLLGGLIVIKASWGKIKSYFQRSSSDEEEENDSDK